jgi:hypothetical protein
MLFSGAWGKLIHEKKLEAKNLDDTVLLLYSIVYSGYVLDPQL